MDRFVSISLFALAVLCLGGAGLLLLGEFVEYLQAGRWRIDSLLDSGYELNLLKSRWFLASELAPDTYVNVMAQYRPQHRVGTEDASGRLRHREIDRHPTPGEMARALEVARDAGLSRFAD